MFLETIIVYFFIFCESNNSSLDILYGFFANWLPSSERFSFFYLKNQLDVFPTKEKLVKKGSSETFRDPETYISSMIKYFPHLLSILNRFTKSPCKFSSCGQ